LIIDTHTHLDHKKFADDVEEVIERGRAAGVEAFIIPGADPVDLPRAIELAEKHDDVYFAVGVHPYDIDKFDEAIFEHLSHPKCVAVGECGLDYYRLPKDEAQKEETKRRQKEVFRRQIEIAKEHDLPLIVHIREASSDAKELLEAHAGSRGGVLHCYNASPILLDLANRGFYYGIGGVVTFQNAKKLTQILPRIPLDRIVIETDAPYLTPHPHRGKRNEPAYTTHIAQKIADLRGMEYDEVCLVCGENAKRLFGI
jgi:TatD DNase family protein